jgi:DNA repair photolyase
MLNISKGNMYEFVTHTWNTIKGHCPHNCTYCYMHRWGKLNPVRFDSKELKTDLGNGNFIFVGSSCDMFADKIPHDWIIETLDYMAKFTNAYLLQSKNPKRLSKYILPWNTSVCTTIETNRHYPDIMKNSPIPDDRAEAMAIFIDSGTPKYITMEPIMDFDTKLMIYWMQQIEPVQVNIGADTGKNNLPEPSKEKILELIHELEKFTRVHQKSNLKRLLK